MTPHLRVCMFVLFVTLFGCSSDPCSSAMDGTPNLVQLFQRLEKEQCLHSMDVETLRSQMNTYHTQTTVHCDQVFRKSSMDGLDFDGDEEFVLDHASVADVWIEKNGQHVIVYNDVTPDKLVTTALENPNKFWQMGLVGFGGLGIAIDPMNGSAIQTIQSNLHLTEPLELVDPDIGRTASGEWRISFFAVTPAHMNETMFGPMSSAKPHNFYRTTSRDLQNFPTPEIIVASKEGSNGGSDPAMLTRADGSEILYIGPLDRTTMGWISVDGKQWNKDAPPDFDSYRAFATPDAVWNSNSEDSLDTYRLYGMTNGRPGEFQVAQSKDGIHFANPKIVLRAPGAFNISVAQDIVGTWWIYYNKTDPSCVAKWGASKILPPHPSVEPLQ